MPRSPRKSSQLVATARFIWAFALRTLLLGALLLYAASAGIFAFLFPMPALLLVGIVAVASQRGRFTSGTHGTARFADGGDLHRAGMLGATGGLVIGRAEPSFRPKPMQLLRQVLQTPMSRPADAIRPVLAPRGRHAEKHGEMIRVKNFTHLATFAPTGAGKGVSQISPNLHLYPSSTVTLDFKGENFAKHAVHRARAFGHTVVRLDYWKVCGPGSGQFNPLDAIDPDSPLAIDDCRSLADAMVVRSGQEKDPHFDDAAVTVLTAAIAFAVFYGKPEERNLQTVRTFVTSAGSFANMATCLQGSTLAGGMLKRLGDSLGHFRDRELGSVMTTVGRHTAFLDSLAVAEGMRRTSFDLGGLKAGTLDLFVIVPPDQMSAQRPLLRLIFGSLLRAVARSGLDETGKVLFLLDEAGQLGRMQAIEDALTLYRGYGVRCWLFYQSIDQVKKCFEHENILLSNVGTISYFGTNDCDTAEAVAKRAGDATIRSTSIQHGTSRSTPTAATAGQPGSPGQFSSNDSVTHAEAARQLLKPNEMLRQSRDELIVFTENLPPIRAKRLVYHRDPEFKRGRLPRAPRLGLIAAARAAAIFLSGAFVAVAAYALATGTLSDTPAMTVPNRVSQATPAKGR